MMLLRSMLLALALWAAGPACAAGETVRIGILAYLGADHTLEDWSGTVAALRAGMAGRAEVTVMPLDHAGIRLALQRREVDFVITNPGHYVELELQEGISRLLTRQSQEPVASTLVVRDDRSDIARFADLRGRTLAVVGTEAFGGYQVASGVLLKNGIDTERDLTLKAVGLPMTAVIRAVVSGAADAGVLRACVLESQQAAGAPEAARLRVLGAVGRSPGGCALSSAVYPDWPIAKARDTAPELARHLALALLSMPPEGTGERWTVPLDYQPVHDLFRELKIGPYAHLRHETLAAFLWRVRHWLALAGVVLIGWIVHVARVERLVRRRTAELAAAHAELMQEMSARRLAEQRDALHLRELDHAGRLSIVGEMASGLAHELNQPLAAIVNYADGCAIRLRSGRADPDSLLAATARIQQQAERAAKVIQHMRAFVRKRDPELVPCNLNAVVQETLGLFEGMVRRAGATVTLAPGEGLPPVRADKVQLQQVLLNLFQNALDAMKDGAGDKHLAVSTHAEAGGACVAVADSGAGLPPAVRERLFEPFFTTKAEGLGLGLALCKSIMDAHQGRLEAGPATGGGTVMTAWLPAAEEGR